MFSFVNDLKRETELSPEELDFVQNNLVVQEVKKGTVLQKAGQVSKNLIYVRKGCLRCYTMDEKGKEHIFSFAPEGMTAFDFVSYSQKTPSKLYVDAVEHTEIETLSLSLTDHLFSEEFKMNKSGVVRMMDRITNLQDRVILLLSASALERYEYFIEKYPSIVQRVPQKMIASYLGITPEALSTIKNKRLK